ncbi:MAG: hypothetical protein CMM28_08155 [Rhodospirillaceae bacterium]|nr:hypothetical protein [Rhodospirillaceae bacterium]
MSRNRLLNLTASLAFVLFGIFMIMGSQRFEDTGRATPMFIGCGIISLAVVLLLIELVRAEMIPAPKKIEGSLPRRGIFVGLMALWVMSLPYLGFVLASSVAFILISAAVPKNTTARRKLSGVSALAGIATTIGFWLVLTNFLNVPLPEPVFF